jgi:hypothetical protein
MTVLYRVVVDIIHMPLIIHLVPNQVLPIATLPNPPLPL